LVQLFVTANRTCVANSWGSDWRHVWWLATESTGLLLLAS